MNFCDNKLKRLFNFISANDKKCENKLILVFLSVYKDAATGEYH